MTKKNIHIEYEELISVNECSSQIQKLFEEANQAKSIAYAPYSNFQVGAALLLENGEIITGNNQENAAFPSGLCAERVAIFAAKSKFPKVAIKDLVVVTSAKNIKVPISPCGGCRQALIEYEFAQKQAFNIYLQSANNSIIKINSAQDLLPFSFHSDMLNA